MKLLIIDDKSQMIELIQKQFENLNKEFHKKNVCFFQSIEEKLEIESFSNDYKVQDCSFLNFSEDLVREKIDEYLLSSKSELVFIVIDMCLKKDIKGNFDISDYYEYGEFCADIYRYLIRLKNTTYNDRKLLFAIYSRSETFVSVISKVLKNQYEKEFDQLKAKDSEINDIPDFPYASCEAQNISWFTNLWRPEDLTPDQKVSDNYPLNLPKNICNYIRTLSDEV